MKSTWLITLIGIVTLITLVVGGLTCYIVLHGLQPKVPLRARQVMILPSASFGSENEDA